MEIVLEFSRETKTIRYTDTQTHTHTHILRGLFISKEWVSAIVGTGVKSIEQVISLETLGLQS